MIFLIIILAISLCAAEGMEGLTQCSGLFLLDQDKNHFSAWNCEANGTIRTKSLNIQAGISQLNYRRSLSLIDSVIGYTGTANFKGSLNLNYIRIESETEFLNLRAKASAMPFISAGATWKPLDSLLYIKADLVRGKPNLVTSSINISDYTSSNLDIESYLEFPFLLKRFGTGTRFKEHGLSASFIDLNSSPNFENRRGYVLFDSLDFKSITGNYTYNGQIHQFSMSYIYADAKASLTGLRREDTDYGLDEKRFFYLPINGSAHLAIVNFDTEIAKGTKRTDLFSINGAALYAEANIPYISRKKGRFHSTIALNQLIENDLLQSLSVSVFNRNFREYGDVYVGGGFIGGSYEWNHKVPINYWKISPSASIYGFYADANIDLERRMETTKLFGIDATTDTLNYHLKTIGAAASIGFTLESPKRTVFLKASASQLLPFYYRCRPLLPITHIVETPAPSENSGSYPGEGNHAYIPTGNSTNQTTTPIDQKDNAASGAGNTTNTPAATGNATAGTTSGNGAIAETSSISDNIVYPTIIDQPEDENSYTVFKNGFAISLKIGIRF